MSYCPFTVCLTLLFHSPSLLLIVSLFSFYCPTLIYHCLTFLINCITSIFVSFPFFLFVSFSSLLFPLPFSPLLSFNLTVFLPHSLSIAHFCLTHFFLTFHTLLSHCYFLCLDILLFLSQCPLFFCLTVLPSFCFTLLLFGHTLF